MPDNPCRVKSCEGEKVRWGFCDEHLREKRPADWAKLHDIKGRTEARLFTPPLGPLTRETSKGFEVIDLANAIGEPLLPWQEWAVIHALELLPGTQDFRFRVVLIIVARQNGKSSLKRIVSLWRLYVDGARLVLGCAQDVTTALEQRDYCLETVRACPDLAEGLEHVHDANGDKWFRLTPEAGGGRYKISASNARAGRGLSVDELNIDELRTQTDWKAWSALSKTTQARRNGQAWAMSNAGDDESVVLNQLQANARAGADDTICLLEWSAPDGCELDDEQAWAQANPALGYLIEPRSIRSAMATDPPAVFRTEVLCQRVASIDSAVDQAAWKACQDETATLEKFRSNLALSFDISPDGEHCSLVAAARVDETHVRIEPVAEWKGTDTAFEELPLLLKRMRPRAFAWYPLGPAAAFATMLRAVKGSQELTGNAVSEACMGLADAVKGGRILQPDDALINAHITGSQKLPSGDGWRFTRRGGAGHCDGAYATAGAVRAALTLPVHRAPQIRSFSY